MGLCVLIIDDDKIFHLLSKALLRQTGITSSPVCCHSGEEVLTYLRQQTPSGTAFLLFLDINMPQMNGWEVLDRLEDLQLQIYVVMVTSSIDKADHEKALTYDRVIDYMIKPLKREKLTALKNSTELGTLFAT